MALLSLSLLGSLLINLDNQPVTGFESVKSRALLAYLADEPGRSYPRSTMAGLLWSDRPENIALNNLRHLLANLRQTIHDTDALFPFLLIDRESIALNPHNDCRIDTQSFRQLVSTATESKQPAILLLSSLEQAASLYRGEFLEAFPQGNSPVFEEWVLTRREYYRSQFLEVLNKLAEISLLQGDFDRVKGYAHRQLEIELWREEAHCQLMETLALEGKRCEALAQYSVCCAVLKKELNVGPSPTTLQLFERIRDGSLSPGKVLRTKPFPLTSQPNPIAVYQPPRLHNLPRSLTSFIGRENEIVRLKQLIHEHYLVTLTGPGGVGKSRLALEVAHQLLGEFRDGVCFVELAQQDHPTQVISATYRALGQGEDFVQPTLEELVNYLDNRQVLLVLDNCEHLIKACAEFVYALLQACPELRILANSREKLGLAGEEIIRVAPLAFPDVRQLPSPENYLDYAAVRLLVDRAQAIQPSFQVTTHNLPIIASICKGLDGLPLAIELAVSHLDILTIEQLATRLTGSFQLLCANNRLAMPRHQIYRESIDWSYQLLSEKERLLLQRLSVFDGGFTLDAAEAVGASEDIPNSEILRLLTALVDKSMLALEGQPELDRRFHPLNTVQQFTLEKLRQSGVEKGLHANHCAYFLKLAEAARPRMRTGEHLTWMRKLDSDRANLFRAIGWAIGEENDISAGLQMLCWLDRWWTSRGYYEPGIRWLRKGLMLWKDSSARAIPLRVEALCLLSKLETNRHIAISLAKQALALAIDQWMDGEREWGMASYTMGFLSRSWEQNGPTAVMYVDQSIQVSKRFLPEHSWEMGYLLDEKSLALLLLRDDQNAGVLARQSWEIFQETGDHWFSYPLSVLGVIAMRQGDYGQARAYLEDALAQRAGEADAWGLGDLVLMSCLECKQGHYGEAVARLREAIQRSIQKFYFFHAIDLLQTLAFTEIECSQEREGLEREKHLLHASRLLGAAEACQSYDWLKVQTFPKMQYNPMVSALGARLDSHKLALAWKEGQAMSIRQAAAYALEYPLVG